jgi:DNA polymerase III delta prime subunit
MQDVIKHSQKKTEKLKAVVSGHQELAAKDKCVSKELTKNIYLRRELDKLKQERTREMWLLKNNLHNLEKANSELQEQLKEQKKAHQGKPLSSLEYFPLTIYLGF